MNDETFRSLLSAMSTPVLGAEDGVKNKTESKSVPFGSGHSFPQSFVISDSTDCIAITPINM